MINYYRYNENLRRGKFLSLESLINNFLKGTSLSKGLNEYRLLSAFDEIVGNGLQKYVSDKYIKNKVLFVHITSSVLRNELIMSRQKLIKALNDKVGATTIINIRFC